MTEESRPPADQAPALRFDPASIRELLASHRERIAARQRRWAGEIVNLDDDSKIVVGRRQADSAAQGRIAKPGAARQGRPDVKPPCTPEQRRCRLAKRLARVRQSLAHCVADAQVCGQLNALERDNIAEDVEVIRGHLHTLLTTVL
jgi:hypothetical protein